ncbi:MAG: hypothetical protein ABI614_11615 [Planctomycetota bacterium]
MIRFLVAASLMLIFVADVDARPRRRRGTVQHNVVSTSYGGGPQQVASSKAQRSASSRIKGHLGGGFGGANAEGVGFSTSSAQAALNSCCYTGQRSVAGSSVVRGSDGWYAVKIYW